MKGLFGTRKPIIGMIHLLPLPTSPGYRGDLQEVYARALQEASDLAAGGVDGLIVENFGDAPYLPNEVGPVETACMAAITREIVRLVDIPVGVNVQFNDYRAELSIALASGASFIRVEVFVDNAISPQGWLPPVSAQALRLRKQLGAESVRILADIHTKYTQPLVPGDLQDSARSAEEAGADALIVTGTGTGAATPLEAVRAAREGTSLPVLVGSGTTLANLAEALDAADGAIVGSSLKRDGVASQPVDPERASAFMARAKELRTG